MTSKIPAAFAGTKVAGTDSWPKLSIKKRKENTIRQRLKYVKNSYLLSYKSNKSYIKWVHLFYIHEKPCYMICFSHSLLIPLNTTMSGVTIWICSYVWIDWQYDLDLTQHTRQIKGFLSLITAKYATYGTTQVLIRQQTLRFRWHLACCLSWHV